MTVFQAVGADSGGAKTFNGHKVDAIPSLRRQLIMVNPTGGPEGKIDEQLGRLGFGLTYLPETLSALDGFISLAVTGGAVILDWRCDRRKDRAFAEALAGAAAEAGLPVLALMAADRTDDVRLASEAGLSNIISMPCRLADLKRALDRLVEPAQSSEAAGSFRFSDAVNLLESCKFRFRTPCDVEKLVPVIARLFPHPERSAAGIAELMMNAIEHGNLEIGHERKADWIARGIYGSELMKRLQTPPFSSRWAELIVNRRDDGFMIVIIDEGCGFCWQDLIRNEQPSEGAVTVPCGDGLLRTGQESFDDLRFNHTGNQVTAFIADDVHSA